MSKRHHAKPPGFPNLTQLAKHKACQLRIPDVCSGDVRTTVGAHVRRAMIAGGGEKPTDLAIIWCCAPCAYVTDNPDQRPAYMTFAELDQMMLHGLCRTLEQVGKVIGV